MLEQYINKWGLRLNLGKTKIMIFNEQEATVTKFKFYFQGQEVEIVKRVFISRIYIDTIRKKHQVIEHLINKVKNFWFILQCLLV